MPFNEFKFPEVQQQLGLSLDEADLFAGVAPLSLPQEFVRSLTEDAHLALAINTEKARSEFIIAPILLELRRLLERRVGLFSGVELNADPSRGLNGVCDFIITRSPLQHVLCAPLITIVEAKNDNLRSGLGQCIAAMVAAQLFNQQTQTAVEAIYGVVTTGSDWKFLRLQGEKITLDLKEYYVIDPGQIMAILAESVRRAG